MNKIIVTGGAGFIGGHLVDFLVSNNYDVLVIDNFSNGSYKNKDAKYVNSNVQDIDSVILRDVDTVYHLAGVLDVEASKKNPSKYFYQNSTTTEKLIKLCVEMNVRKFVYASSCASAFSHSSPYALSKYIPELYCKTYDNLFDIDTVSLRFFNVYGDRMNHSGYKLVLSIFLEQFRNNKPLTVTNDGTQRRDFVHVNDIVSALYNSKSIKTNGEVLDVASNETHSILDLVKMFDSKYEFIGQRDEEEIAFANIEKTMKILNWKPKHKIEDYIKWSVTK